MMKCASELEAISLSLPFIAELSGLQRLRHLVLEAHEGFARQLLGDLSQDTGCMPNLETLHLSMRHVQPYFTLFAYLWMQKQKNCAWIGCSGCSMSPSCVFCPTNWCFRKGVA